MAREPRNVTKPRCSSIEAGCGSRSPQISSFSFRGYGTPTYLTVKVNHLIMCYEFNGRAPPQLTPPGVYDGLRQLAAALPCRAGLTRPRLVGLAFVQTPAFLREPCVTSQVVRAASSTLGCPLAYLRFKLSVAQCQMSRTTSRPSAILDCHRTSSARPASSWVDGGVRVRRPLTKLTTHRGPPYAPLAKW